MFDKLIDEVWSEQQTSVILLTLKKREGSKRHQIETKNLSVEHETFED